MSTGTGEPEFKIVFKYPNYEEVKAAVVARVKAVKSGSDTVDITMPATTSLMPLVAEGHFTLDGFGNGEDGTWRLKAVEWLLSKPGMQVRLSGNHRTLTMGRKIVNTGYYLFLLQRKSKMGKRLY